MARHDVSWGIPRARLLLVLLVSPICPDVVDGRPNIAAPSEGWADTLISQPARALRARTLKVGDTLTIKVRDGSQIVGRLVGETADQLTLTTSYGEVRIARAEIAEWARIEPEDIREGGYWFPDPNRTRSFVFPTASTLRQGAGLYENYYLFFNSVHFGVTDRAMLSGGIVPLPGAMILAFGPKLRIYQHPTKMVEAAVGAQWYLLSGDSDSETLFVPYGVLSLGRSDRSRLSVGGGSIRAEEEDLSLLTVSADLRLSKRVKLMGEVFSVRGDDESEVIPIYGLRFFSERLAFDLGFWNFPGEEDLLALGTPMANFVFGF